jgi:hypothetical protein
MLIAAFFLISCKLQAQYPLLPKNVHTVILKKCWVCFSQFAAQAFQYKKPLETPGPLAQNPDYPNDEKKSCLKSQL